jgi:DUF438 domain-containing protein
MSERLIDRLSKDQIEAILDALPIEFIFVDEEDRLQYYNKGEKRTRSGPDDILGRDIRQCHKAESLPRTDAMLDGFRRGERDEDEFWVEGLGTKLLNRFLAVRDKSGRYLGCLEYLLDFTALEKLARDKADSHRFTVDSSRPDEIVDEH